MSIRSNCVRSWLLTKNQFNSVKSAASSIQFKSIRNVSSDKDSCGSDSKSSSFDGFIKHIQAVQNSLKESKLNDVNEPKQQGSVATQQSFASLLRRSRLIKWGDFTQGIVTTGRIVHVMGDDLYIDFGAKFQMVCRRPSQKSERYVRYAKVRVRVNSLELSTRFLGSDTDMTLLEADGHILQLIESPVPDSVTSKAPDYRQPHQSIPTSKNI